MLCFGRVEHTSLSLVPFLATCKHPADFLISAGCFSFYASKSSLVFCNGTGSTVNQGNSVRALLLSRCAYRRSRSASSALYNIPLLPGNRQRCIPNALPHSVTVWA